MTDFKFWQRLLLYSDLSLMQVIECFVFEKKFRPSETFDPTNIKKTAPFKVGGMSDFWGAVRIFQTAFFDDVT